MTAVEIILLLIGVVFMIGSFFVTEKLSQKEITQISELSSVAMKRIMENNMGHANARIQEMANQVIDQCMVDTKRAMERETNLKIQDISEYSVTVIEDIHKNHSEVMFLYSMLNEKHTELMQMAGNLERLKSEMERLEEELTVTVAETSEVIRTMSDPEFPKEYHREPRKESYTNIMDEGEELLEGDEDLGDLEDLEEEFIHIGNQNQNILELYQKKMDPREIARQLGVGIGEVKLVIDLYRGDGS